MLMIFDSMRDIHPQASIDLRGSVVIADDGAVIRIRNMYHESWHLKCLTGSDAMKWFR